MGFTDSAANPATPREQLVELGIIGDRTKADLDWVWEIRCREHLMDLGHVEYNRYIRGDYNRALTAYGELRDAMEARYG